ncbi:hypothetical protein F4802DRAFT_603653 [Xylaria palmicola]|nr:hypothetical protein F4802DRAFT_603653 [Xylaria palmicola]
MLRVARSSDKAKTFGHLTQAKPGRYIAAQEIARLAELLSLVAVDVSGDGALGIDYDVARVACSIVADNRWDDATYIATRGRVEGSSYCRVSQPEDGILPIPASSMAYCVVVDYPANRYAVVPRFEHWRFPHGNSPPTPWYALRISGGSGVSGADSRIAALHRDQSCRVTGSLEAFEATYIVPYADHEWLKSNNMRRYCHLPETTHSINDDVNLLMLRTDVQVLLDQHRFVLVPKTEDIDASALRLLTTLVVHAVLPKGSCEISYYFYNCPCNTTSSESPIYRFFGGGPLQYTVRLYDKERGDQRSEDLSRNELGDRGRLACSSRLLQALGDYESGAEESDDPDEGESHWDCEDDRPRGRKRYRSANYYRHHQKLQGSFETEVIHSPAGLSFTSSTVLAASPLSPERSDNSVIANPQIPTHEQERDKWPLKEDMLETHSQEGYQALILLHFTKRQKI